MDYKKEIRRRDRRIDSYRKQVAQLNDEIIALRQLLDCAAANIVLLVRDKGGMRSLSKKEVSEALGKYRLAARNDGEGNYVLEIENQ